MKNDPSVPDGYHKQKVWVEFGSINPRPASLTRTVLDPVYVADYAEDFDNAPAVLVVHDRDDHHFLADGYHRFAAAKKLGLKGIECHIKQGVYLDALRTAMEVNEDRHGLPLTTADRLHWLDEALKHPEMSTWSAHKLSEFCGLSVDTVLKRKNLVLSDSNSTTVVGRDGKVRPATRKDDPRSTVEKCAEIEAVLREHPDWSIAAVAGHCAVSRPLVRNVRQKIGMGSSQAKGGRPKGASNGKPSATSLFPPETGSQVPTVGNSETGPEVPTVGTSDGSGEAVAVNGRADSRINLDDLWEVESALIWGRFRLWPEANRGFYVFRLRSLTNVLIDHCPNVVDRSGQPLIKKG